MFPKIPFVCLLLVVTVVHASPAGIGDVFGTIKNTVVDNNPIVGIGKDVTKVGGEVTKPFTDVLNGENPIYYILDTLKNAIDAGELSLYITEIRNLIQKGAIRDALQLVVSPKFISALQKAVVGLLQNQDFRNVLQTLIVGRIITLVTNLRQRFLNA